MGNDSFSEDSTTPEDDATTLYVYRDKFGAVLYIGITKRTTKRLFEHTTTAAWWPSVATAEFEHFSSREKAERAEREAVLHFLPVFNIVYNVNDPEFRNAYLRKGPRMVGELDKRTIDGISDGKRVLFPIERTTEKVFRKLVPRHLFIGHVEVRSIEFVDDQIVVIPIREIEKGRAVFWRRLGAPWRIDLESEATGSVGL